MAVEPITQANQCKRQNCQPGNESAAVLFNTTDDVIRAGSRSREGGSRLGIFSCVGRGDCLHAVLISGGFAARRTATFQLGSEVQFLLKYPQISKQTLEGLIALFPVLSESLADDMSQLSWHVGRQRRERLGFFVK